MLSWLFEIVAKTSTSVLFFSIFLGGVVFSLLSIIFGGHGEGDHDGDHDFGGDHDMDHGGEHGGEHHDGDHGESGINLSPSILLSVRGMALLATGFGGVGFVTHVYTGKILFSTISGMLAGYVFAILIVGALRSLTKQQANSLIQSTSAVGVTGIVATSILPGEIGEVRLVVSGTEMTRLALAADDTHLKAGTPVVVNRVEGGTLIVSPVSRQNEVPALRNGTQVQTPKEV